MDIFIRLGSLLVFGVLWMTVLTSGAAAAVPPPEFDPVLSLTGNCSTGPFDPIPDPSCTGEPPAYPPPPGRPAGRFNEPRAIAVDAYGNEYVASYAESEDAQGRIDIFDDEGKFITEFNAPNAKSVAVDSIGNTYVFEDSGKVVRYPPEEGYDPESGEIEYEDPPVTVATGPFIGDLSVDPSNDELFVAAQGVITRYRSAIEGNGVVESFEPKGIGTWTEEIAVDGQRRRLYVSYCRDTVKECAVKILAADPSHEVLEEIDGSTTPGGEFFSLFGRLGVAVDEGTGDFFVADIPSAKKVYQFSEDYEYRSELTSSEFQANISMEIAVSNGERSLEAEPCGYPETAPPPGDACNRHYLFVPVLKSAGRALAFRPSDIGPPEVEEVSAAGIAGAEAELRATINPGGADTSYLLEYTTEEAFEAEGFEGAVVAGEGVISGSALATKVSAFITDLKPGVSYHFRAVAENEAGEDTEEGAFTTYNDAPFTKECSNTSLRIGLSSNLSDCRAYELVSPPNTNGRPPRGVGFVGDLFTTTFSSPMGERLSFKIEGGSLPGSTGVGSFEGDPYLATRGPSGWSSTLSGPSGNEATVTIPASVSPDQRYSFWTARIEGPLVIDGEPAQYVHYPDGHSELVGRGSLGTDPKAHGKLITEDAGHIIFQTESVFPAKAIQLEPEAPPTGTATVYDRTPDEVTHVVSLLPGDVTPAAGQSATYRGASKDGEGIAFTIGTKLYLRVGNETTYEIGEDIEFAGVSEGGERIFYVEGGDLEAFDTSTEEVLEFSTSGDVTPVNVATGGTRAYFVSPSVLDGTNPQGDAPGPPASGQGTLGAKGSGTLAVAKGTGTLTSEWTHVTGVSTEEGTFQKGMQITGDGIPAGTTIKAVEPGTLILSQAATKSGSTALSASSTKVTGVSTSVGVFEKGMQITGTGIPADTTIEAVGSSTLTLSKAPTQAGATALVAGSRTVTGVSTGAGTLRVGMNITGTGIPSGTVIIAINAGAQTLTLSKEADATGSQALSAFAQNLYLSEEGAISFVATVTGRDVEGEPEPFGTALFDGLGLWTVEVGDQVARDPSRTNPDGSALLFQSRANITGYEESEFPQIYRYDSDAGRLHCISCIPTGASSTGGASLESYTFDSLSPLPFSPYGYVANLTPDGRRVFFESTEALVSSDTDEVKDVYEWEEEGVGSCDRVGGCVYLISTGQSSRDNFLYAHSTSGNDVFFTTGDALTGSDTGGATSIYDAKVGGGFPEHGDPLPCTADGCRPTVNSAPPVPSPESSAQGHSGNRKTAKPKTCPKGKRKVKKNGKVRCVKKKKHKAKGGKAKQRASANRGAGK